MKDDSKHVRTEYVLNEITSHQNAVVSDFKYADDLSVRIKTQER